ncbi:Uncharacterised protein [Vibrio cholerae]|nr:Uncharacterised protein [Vibrio cholerae]CSC77464.1 Uncharacterised protein [Vibrio cholerae]CSH88648.1 Uncharacterised protein [Vibrio cholerae]
MLGPFGAAIDTIEIKKNRRIEQSLRVGIINPVSKAGFPFFASHAPFRIASHDLTITQWVSAAV